MLTPFAYKPLAFALKNRNHAHEMKRLSPWLYYHRPAAMGKSTTRSLLLAYQLEQLETEAQLAIIGRARIHELMTRRPFTPKVVEPKPFSHYDELAFFKA